MAMAWIWTGMVTVSLVFAAVNGTMDAVSAAALEGAGAAVELCIAMAGVLCLWSGVMELMSRCGLSRKLAAALRPALGRLLPRASRDPETLAAVSANVSANLLGLGNAATPLGIRAARRMARGQDGVADDELCRLVVPKASRATGYGVFECAFGVFWFLGSWLLGVLYDVSIPAMIAVSVAAQLAAIPLYIASSRRIKANP